MNLKLVCIRFVRAAVAVCFGLMAGQTAVSAATLTLQGQSKGDPTWIPGNLLNWQELDFIPCRVYITGGPVTNQSVTISFPHLTPPIPGVQDLFYFSTSTNAIITSGPTLITDPSGVWSYTFTVTANDANPAYVQFSARLAAGAHLNSGSSLMLGGNPTSMGNLQIHKPAPGPGAPNLALVKSGPATTSPGAVITYTLSYTNRATGTNTAVGSQAFDILPDGISVNPTNVSGGEVVGNTIFWDLGNLPPGAHGQISFLAQVSATATNGQVLTNYAEIKSSEIDASYSDNISSVTTTVIITCTPVTITQDPLSQTNCPGTSASFSVGVTGTGPFTYQWRKDGSNIPNATNSTYSIDFVSAANAGSYSVVVNNGCGSKTSGAAFLSVNTPVSATPLVSQTNCPGTTVVFSTAASGTGPFNYAWFKDGSLINGQSSSSLTLNNVSSTNAGLYSVVVNGACNSVTNSATLSINTPVRATPLVSQTNCPGTTVVFSTVASGSGPFNYAWFKDGSLINGQNGSSLTLNNVTSTNAGLYSVVVNGACNSVTNSATLSINTPVNATLLVSQTNCPGTTVVFSTVASGTGPFNYAWFKDGSLINGQNGSSLTLNNVSSTNAGLYSVVVSGACNSVTNSATLSINTPVNATPLVSQTNCPGTTVVFSTVASGTGPFNYAWFKDGSLINGQNGSSLTLNNVSSTNAGLYSVIVSGACGSVTNSATLSVNAMVSATPLANLVRNPGETAVFVTTASGAGPFFYVWKKNGTIINGQNTNSLTLTNVTVADEATYTVEVTGECGMASQSASLHINLAPTVNIFNPTNGTVLIAPASFVIAANAQDSDGTVTNVEFFQGTNKVGETTIGNPYVVSLTNLAAGSYSFTAKATDNGGLIATSAPVNVTVITNLPLTVLAGVHFNPQTGLYEQTVRVTNPGFLAIDAIRVYVLGLSSSMHVYNASGTTNGVPYVQSGTSVPPGGYTDFVIEYYVTSPGVPNPTLIAQAVSSTGGGGTAVSGAGVPINRSFMTANGFLVEFASQLNRIYYVQYTTDFKTWKTALPAVTGNGTWIQWIDNGQPKTESAPATTSMRYYRIIAVSQ